MSDGKRQTSPRIKSKRKTKPRKKAAISRSCCSPRWRSFIFAAYNILPERLREAAFQPMLCQFRSVAAQSAGSTASIGTDPSCFLSPFQSCCRSRRCPVRPKACWRRENSSGQSQRVLWNVRQGCCSAPAVRPPVHGSDTGTVPSDSIRLCPAQILAQRWLFLPMPTKRPSRAWTVPDAAYIVLRVAVLLIPAQ